MSSTDGDHPRPGVADLGAFRGRTNRVGVPVLPPGWRPDRTDDRAPVRLQEMVEPVAPPPAAPIAFPAPEATVLPARTVYDEVRVVRRIRPWSVWKLALAFGVCMVGVVTTSAALLWAAATSLGVLDNVEGFVEDLGFDDFTLDGGAMFRALVVGGLLAAAAASVMAYVLTVMYNLLTDITGGLETELAPKRPRRRRARSAAPARATRGSRSRPPGRRR